VVRAHGAVDRRRARDVAQRAAVAVVALAVVLDCSPLLVATVANVNVGTFNWYTNTTTQIAKLFSTGNFILQNGGTFTDNGYRLQVSGSGAASGSLYVDGFTNHLGTISSSIVPANNPSASLMLIGGTTTQNSTLSGSSAILVNTVMSASANNQSLVGLDIQPTFNNGSFTGMSNIAVRVNGKIYSSTTILDIGRNNTLGVLYADNNETTIGNTSATAVTQFRVGGVNMGRFFATTGNFTLQNGGTFTDNGYRLDVIGSTRVKGAGTTSATTALTVQNANASSSLVVLDNGNVGMGISTPNYRLDVSGSGNFTNNLTITGSIINQPITLPTASGTASMDCSRSNFFNLTLSGSYTLFLSASNIQPGQTVNLRVIQPATSGSLNYGSQFKFAGGIPYSASSTGSAVDIVSFISYDTTTLYGSAIKNLS
jgi:hypothetical protein